MSRLTLTLRSKSKLHNKQVASFAGCSLFFLFAYPQYSALNYLRHRCACISLCLLQGQRAGDRQKSALHCTLHLISLSFNPFTSKGIQRGPQMTNVTPQEHNGTATKISIETVQNEIRMNVLPGLNKLIYDSVSNIVNDLTPPDTTGLGIFQTMDKLEQFAEEQSKSTLILIVHEVKAMLNPGQHLEPAADTSEPTSADNNSKAEDVKAIAAPINQHMPTEQIREIIDRFVSEEQIQKVLEMTHKGMTPAEIRATKIGLNEQVIQTIVNDNPNYKTPEELKAEAEQKAREKQEFKEREVVRLHKRGHTLDYICTKLQLEKDAVESLIPELPVEESEPTATTLALIKASTESPERTAALYNLRPDVVAHHMNGIHA